jgi:meso-butanediol dehydrogenase/(S,S)-butanediol dehydrogenase/diacetyl reductase
VNRRVALVGASTAMGAAITERFRRDGDVVVGISLEAADNPALAAELVFDCADPHQADAAIAAAVQVMGGIDVLVAAAGYEPVAAAHKTSDDDWRAAMSACLDTYFFTARAAIPLLAPGSAIVAVSSVNARVAAPWLAAYTAAKGGVDALTRQLAFEYGPRGIRTNAVAPGLVGPERYPDSHAGYPLGHAISHDEVAEAIAFLASAAASGINGVVLPVDGGISISSPAAYLREDLKARTAALPE